MSGAAPSDRIGGIFLLALDVSAFQSPEEHGARVAAYIEQLKTVPAQEGVDEILVPSERAARTAAERRAQGIPVPDDVWNTLRVAAAEWGLPWPIP